MHIFIALATAAAAPVVLPQAPVEHEVSVFQQDFPMSHRDGRREYERFLSKGIFDDSGRPRTVGLTECSRTCSYLTLRMEEKTGSEWTQGEMVPTANAGYAFKGQKGRISYAGGAGSLRIEDHVLDAATGTQPTTGYHVTDLAFSGMRGEWSYGPTFSENGSPVMRLLVVWENAPRSPRR